MFKKTITTIALIGALSISAYANTEAEKKQFCSNIDGNLASIFDKNAINLDNRDTSDSSIRVNEVVAIKSCKIAMSDFIGMDYNFQIKSTDGDVYNYNTGRFCSQVEGYIHHIDQKYKNDGDINLLYNTFSYMFRLTDAGLNSDAGFKKILETNPPFAKGFRTYKYGTERYSKGDGISATNFAYSIWKNGNQSKVRGVGYRDPKFWKFLNLVIQGEFNRADQFIDKEIFTSNYNVNFDQKKNQITEDYYEKGTKIKFNNGVDIVNLANKSMVDTSHTYIIIQVYSNQNIIELRSLNDGTVIGVNTEQIAGNFTYDKNGQVRYYAQGICSNYK